MLLSLCFIKDVRNSKKETAIYSTKLHNHEIKIEIPDLKYQTINEIIIKKMEEYQKNFQQFLTDSNIQPNQSYTLSITYEMLQKNLILSYVFFIEEYTGGAHPNHYIWTINFNKENETRITIEDLIKEYPHLLQKLSEKTREYYILNPNINIAMMLEGTKPIKENFLNFAFSEKEFLIFFPHYQIAPYSSGYFTFRIPYQQLFKQKNYFDLKTQNHF